MNWAAVAAGACLVNWVIVWRSVGQVLKLRRRVAELERENESLRTWHDA